MVINGIKDSGVYGAHRAKARSCNDQAKQWLASRSQQMWRRVLRADADIFLGQIDSNYLMRLHGRWTYKRKYWTTGHWYLPQSQRRRIAHHPKHHTPLVLARFDAISITYSIRHPQDSQLRLPRSTELMDLHT